MKKVAVLGSGSFGCSIANVLSDNNNEIYLWVYNESEYEQLKKTYENPYIKGAKINKDIKLTMDINIVNEVDYVIYVVPSFALRQTSKLIQSVLTKEQNFVICTKGLEANTMKSGYVIVLEEIDKVKNVSILSGPTHAEELAFKKYTAIVSTAKSEDYAKEVQKIFNNEYLRVYINTDIDGVELLGASKNVLAIAAGVCDSHPKLGDNAKAALLTRGLRELMLIGETQGANPETFYGLTGLGDLIVTATSKHSRNRKFGELIGQGYTKEQAQEQIGMVVEGIYSVEALQQLNQKTKKNLPIIESIYKFLFEGQTIEQILEDTFKRDMKREY